MIKQVSPQSVYDQLALAGAPLVVDVRSNEELERSSRFIPSAVHRAAHLASTWLPKTPLNRPITLYSTQGQELTFLANSLAARGARVSVLAAGIEGWLEGGHPTIKVRRDLKVPGGSQWVTRERPKIDRLACPWLVRRFIDPNARFFYVPAARVRAEAQVLDAQPYDIPDVTFSHRGANCSFDAFLDEFDLHDPVLDDLATIVRAADTGTLELAREAPGLLAISLGLSASIAQDQLLLEQAMTVYDALYAWRKTARDESHSWPQKVAQR